MEIAGITDEELRRTMPGFDRENLFVTKLIPEKIISGGKDKTATNMDDQTSWTLLWVTEENEDNVSALMIDLVSFDMWTYIKVE